jgi:murein DD-endopeptidase MepM/ murein hydrolase activator NlpD
MLKDREFSDICPVARFPSSKFRAWWLERFRLSLLERNTFSERWQIGISRWGVAMAGVTLVALIAGLTYFLVAQTSMREWAVPGYLAQTAREDARLARNTADSALLVLEQQTRYLEALQTILRGDVPLDDNLSASMDSLVASEFDLDVAPEAMDSALRARISEEDRFALRRSSLDPLNSRGMSFRPVNGPVSDGYDASTGHYGIDFIAPEGSMVHAVDDGTVLLASYTVDGGYVLAIQHKANRLSIYKHNSSLLHEPGDVVRSGDAIAILGGTGTTSKGPHCHFEWWVDGAPLDPTPWLPGLASEP